MQGIAPLWLYSPVLVDYARPTDSIGRSNMGCNENLNSVHVSQTWPDARDIPTQSMDMDLLSLHQYSC